MEHKNYNAIHKSVRKKDSMQLLLGKPVYTDDITGPALVVKLLRSPHANAIVEEIHTEIAKKIPGVVDIYTWEDVPKTRFAIAGQTYPEPSPYDRLIIDRTCGLWEMLSQSLQQRMKSGMQSDEACESEIQCVRAGA